MDKKNHFSEKFKNKTSDDLRQVIFNDGYQEDAKKAALWELETRSELTEEDKKKLSVFEAENERIRASKLTGKRYDTVGRRIVAAIIDGFVLWPIAAILDYVSNSNIGAIVVASSLIKELLPYLYSVLLHGEYGKTVGKMAMGIKVVDFKTERAIGFKEAFLRDSVPIALLILSYAYAAILLGDLDKDNLAVEFYRLTPILFIGSLALLWTLLEILTMLFNSKSRALHDFLAGTVVVRDD